ncbi:MATE family efflux transporter [Pseudidiomarina sp. 1APP75-27a]|uniref:MATE family efflux transporter n=1 Tax=Pseudidiomarina terrestris TaxID=2820060 RepID=UPI002B05B4E4|nr:MATE family efflux transporter [Pseudidiomarina sp. 1APP75-27a]MEA3587342.1 MATE family efflux transporter [Pseudidiomarina sp. 1APP75-27a]
MPRAADHWWTESKKLAKLTGPILIAQLTQMLMSVVDTVMAGRVSAVDLAAVSVGGSIWLPSTLLVFGLALALAPIISHFDGAKKQQKIANMVQQGFYAALIGSLLCVAVILSAPLILNAMNVEDAFRVITLDYLFYLLWAIPALVIYMVLRNFCEGLSHTMPSLVIGVLGLLVNIPANYILIYGKFGAPALGGAGCGVATAIVLWVMALGLLVYVLCAKRFKALRLFSQWHRPDWDDVWYIIRLGFPIATSMFFEVSLFAAAALVIAPLGATVVAGHQIALNISSLVYMVPLSLSMAVTLRVGFALGAGNPSNAMLSHKLATLYGMTFAGVNGLIMYLGGAWLASLYTSDQAVIQLAATLMGLAAIFTLSDTFQAIAMGTLRGYKDTKVVMFITFLSYWPLGLTVGILLSLTDVLVPALGAAGMWIGFIVGLSCAAVLLTWRLRVVSRRYAHTHQVQINADADAESSAHH